MADQSKLAEFAELRELLRRIRARNADGNVDEIMHVVDSETDLMREEGRRS